VIVSAALCPSAPLLVPELGGRNPPLPQLREAAERAVAAMLGAGPDVVAVVGPAPATAAWPADTPVDLGPLRGSATTRRPALPLSLGLGATVLRGAGYAGRTLFQGVAGDAPAQVCAAVGRAVADAGARVGLVVVGDGSARRSPAAPGWFDERAAAFDAATEHAVRSGELEALLDLDADLAAALLAAGRPAWQALAGAARGLACTSRLDYADAPFGVAYLVAALRFAAPAGHDRG
jgi:hypothetical protein